MVSPDRRPHLADLDDGPLTPEEEAALVARIDAAWAEGGEPVPADVVFAQLQAEADN